MRRAAWRIIGFIAAVAGLLLFSALLLLIAGNSSSGREFIEKKLPDWSGGTVTLAGLSGRFPDALYIGRLELSDGKGPWLLAEDLELDWSPFLLLLGTARIDRLEAGHLTVLRQPHYASSPAPSGGAPTHLSLQVELPALHVGRLDLLKPVIGQAAAIAADASAHLISLAQGDIHISLRRLDAEGAYRIDGRLEPEAIRAHLSVSEPPRGLLSCLVRLPELGALSVHAALEGPRSAANLTLTLTAGPLNASAHGVIDIADQSMNMKASVSAPAMKPGPDLSWESVALDARVSGPFAKPLANGKLDIVELSADGAGFHRLEAHWDADTEQANLAARLDGLRVPGPRADILQAAPLIFEAHARLDAADRPVVFSLTHPLVKSEGRFATLGSLQGEAHLTLPDLTPFAALAGMHLKGASTLDLRTRLRGDGAALELSGQLGITAGKGPLPALVGEASTIAVAAELEGRNIKLSRMRFEGKSLDFSANGDLVANRIDLHWKLALADLGVLTETLSGPISAQGSLFGPTENFAVAAELNGELATRGFAAAPMAAKVQLTGLPDSPSGRIKAQGKLAGSPLDIDLGLQRKAACATALMIERADWKSAHAVGTLTLNKGATLPVGEIGLSVGRLADFGQLLGEPLSGSLSARMEAKQPGAHPQAFVEIEARNIAVAGRAGIGQASLITLITNPTVNPRLEGRLSLNDVKAGGHAGSARMDWNGDLEALRMSVSAVSPSPPGGGTQLVSQAVLDAKSKKLDLASLKLTSKGETLSLLAPARIAFAEGVNLSPIRLGFRQGTLEIQGRIAPTLDLALAMRDIPANLAAPFAAEFDLAGMLQAEGSVTGTPAQPIASFRIEASNIRQRKGPGAGLPPVQLMASASLADNIADIDARLTAGPVMTLALTGQASAGGLLDLRASGTADLKMLNPLLGAGGRRVQGQAILDVAIQGPFKAPQARGSLRLTKGDFEDFSLGAHIGDINALLEASGETIRITRFDGRAGPGTIKAEGSVEVLRPDMPIKLSLIARNARPLSSDRLTVNLDSHLDIDGNALGAINVVGAIHVNRAEISIPEHLPASIAVLKVRDPNAPPPALAEKPRSNLVVDLKIDAPGQIFVRGRGLDAELGGRIQVRGAIDDLQPEGRFQMRRGQFDLAGQTLSFSKGEVSFDGGTLTDPALKFVASKSNGNITATITVSGTARKPKITLQSVPELPQDEVLAQLLFASSTSNLGPLQLAQIASALASLTGAASGIGGTLEQVRKGLGLSRLSMGGGQTGPTLEAGKYVAPGIYMGAKQGLSATTTQGAVQIDITRRLKLEGAIGTGSTTTSNSGSGSVGILYQYEY